MNQVSISIRFLALMTILTGVIYPFLMTGIGKIVYPNLTEGSLVRRDGVLVGSYLIAQKFEARKYFQSRPSAVDFNPLPSGGSNLSLTSQALKDVVKKRSEELRRTHGMEKTPPADLLFASGSGLDPHISPEAAYYQVISVAAARGLKPEVVSKLIDRKTEKLQWGVFGQERVNVLSINLALDDMAKELHEP